MTNNIPDKYRYIPLKTPSSIRLLSLLPGEFEDELSCELHETDLEDAGTYECISYVWGDVLHRARIRIRAEEGALSLGWQNDHKSNSTQLFSARRFLSKVGLRSVSKHFGWLFVPKNLDLALRRFRRKDVERVLWADSICINQDSIDERNAQVKIMGQIYSSAETVLIWLGEEFEQGEVNEAYQCCREIAYNVEDKINHLAKIGSAYLKHDNVDLNLNLETHTDTNSLHNQLDIPMPTTKQFTSFATLIRNPWFTRAWTWQESIVAKQRLIYWSDQQLDRATIFDAARVTLALCSLSGGAIHLLLFDACCRVMSSLGYVDLRIGNQPPWILNLSLLLVVRMGAACKYPSDQVYSLLGIFGQNTDIVVDYNRSFGDTYARTTYFIVQKENSLGVLSFVDEPRKDDELPSWVPDWRNEYKGIFSITSSADNHCYSATGRSSVRVKLSADNKMLQVFGIRFERIKETKCWRLHDIVDWIDSHLESDNNGEKRYAYTNETAREVWRRTVLRDNFGNSVNKFGDRARWKADTHDLIRTIESSRYDGERGRAAFKSHSDRLTQHALRMTFICSTHGYIGLAGDIVRVGDEIVFLCGAEVPLLLRRREQGSNTYRFIAECYLHGFMDGEAFVEARRAANPGEKLTDTSWLDTIGDDELPFPFTEFSII